MVDFPAHDCLDPEVLAAYADQGLSLAERARVETHLAACPRCTTLLAGAIRTVAALAPAEHEHGTEDATPLVSRRSALGMAAAVAAVLVVLAVPPVLGPRLQRDTGLVNLAGSVGEHRSVLGRLSGGFPHAPLMAPSAGGQDGRAAGTDGVRLTSGRIRGSSGELGTPSQLHAAGLEHLLSRRYDAAAQLLLAASREQPNNARYLSDAAAVHLERARLGLRPNDLPRALAAAERATRLDPSLREAWFNRALAITALSLTDQARAAWTEYLKRDAASPWAAEARQKLDELARPGPAAAWDGMAARLDQSIDAATADAAVRAQTTEARKYIENELFVAWADAVLAGNDGRRELQRIRVMAEAMLRVTGDALYRDATASVDRASVATVSQIAATYRAYANAAALVLDDRFNDALAAMTQARGQLAALNNPVSQLASLGLGTIAYVRGRYDEVEQLLAPISAGDYAYARARASWLRGLAAFAQGRYADAQSLYDETLDAFQRMGDVEQTGSAHSLLAGLAYHLGDKTAEWQHRQAAFDTLPVIRSARTKYSILAPAADSARTENPESALMLQESALAVARESGRVAAIVEIVAQRGATLFTLGRQSDAANSVSEARRQLSQVPDPSFRAILELPVLALDSDLLRASAPAQAAALAQNGIATILARNDRSRLPRFQLRLAKANIMRDHLEEAERALAAGIQAFDETRATPAGVSGISAFDESWQLYESAVQLAVHRGNYERAFAMAERGRAQIPATALQPTQAPSMSELQEMLQPEEAVIALHQFDDELAVWVIKNDSSHVGRRPLRKTDARRLVARLQDEIRLQAAPGASAALYDAIVRPVTEQLSGVRRLSFVPDATYQNVSFAALWDRSRNRFLMENWTLLIAPSMTSLRVSRDASSTQRDFSRALVLSAGPDAARVKAIADQYPFAELVSGQDATRSKLFVGAPVLHVSAPTHRADLYPSLSRLVLNDEPGRKYSGAVMTAEIASRSMTATRVVVLDEVRTQQSYRTAGTFDLATAFLAAGVPVVLGTLPGADESATRELMLGLHRELARQASPAEALSRVQRNALQQNGRRLGAWTALVMYGSDR